MMLLITVHGCLISCVLMVVLQTGVAYDHDKPCRDDNDCLPPETCEDHQMTCFCNTNKCEEQRLFGEPCRNGTGTCMCLQPYSKMDSNRCMLAHGFDAISKYIIPLIIVMSAGAMIYVGIKLFCNCGKVWRRERSELTRELEGMSSTPHQQTWVASYRVFSPLNNQSQPHLHSTPCMGLFVPNMTSSPPPYEEALKHKVILSSYASPQYSYEPQPPPVDETNQRVRTVIATERDQTRPLRYYPGEGNPQIPPVWNSVRMTELEEVHHQDRDHSRVPNVYRESRNARGSRSSRLYSPDQTRRTSAEGT